MEQGWIGKAGLDWMATCWIGWSRIGLDGAWFVRIGLSRVGMDGAG